MNKLKTYIKKEPSIALFLIVITILLIVMGWDCYALSKNNIWADEFEFLTLSSKLPSYSTSESWLLEHTLFLNINFNDPIIKEAYNNPVWVHPPVPVILMYPITKIFPDFINQIWIYRILYMGIAFMTVMLFADVIRKKWGWVIASISIVPFLLAHNLLMAGAYVYNDAWMCLFLAISVWIINVKYDSKWKYVTMIAMTLSKIYAFALIIPLILMQKNKKDMLYTLLCGCSLGLFLIYQKVVSGNISYFNGSLSSISEFNWSMLKIFVNDIQNYITGWGLYVSIPLIMIGIWLWIKNRFRELHYSFVVMFIVLLGLAINGGLSGYKTFPVLYGVMFLTIPIGLRLVEMEKKSGKNKVGVLIEQDNKVH